MMKLVRQNSSVRNIVAAEKLENCFHYEGYYLALGLLNSNYKTLVQKWLKNVTRKITTSALRKENKTQQTSLQTNN